MHYPRGLYDLLITEGVDRALAALGGDVPDVEDLSSEGAAERLIDALGVQLRAILDAEAGSEGRTTQQAVLVNALLAAARERSPDGGDGVVDPVKLPPRLLRGVRTAAHSPLNSPATGLAIPWLFTAGRGSPSLLNEIRREAAACDGIDILVSFITVSGVRKLMDVLQTATSADASGAGRTRIRVLTTTYTGATELEALRQLARLNDCTVRISLDGSRSRLHAKAWIFRRRTGFGSAYVGSANLSGAALMGGLEWTVKFTERGQRALYAQADAHFETLWADPEFTEFVPDDPDCVRAVATALRAESGELRQPDSANFDIQPRPFQQELLDHLWRERSLGRSRNLLVAATGTGKTVVAALDYRETCRRLGHRPRLLFVAHRAQILRQARAVFRGVLRDNAFGEVLTGGPNPPQFDFLFASIQTLTSRDLVSQLGPDYWDTVVIDECHHLAAGQFTRLAEAIRPRILLGLTATPERGDGIRIDRFFTPRPDGAPAAELRLWDALDMQLLAPFEYYGCDDDTDLSHVRWGADSEREDIDRVVTGNVARARRIVSEWRRLTGDPTKSRALVFCVTVEHAEFMTRQLELSGIRAALVVGTTPKFEQLRAPKRLASGEISAIVTVDLYNEGVDIPEVDTLLFLRPTQSPVVFQQQLGRGLRLHDGKTSCLVLDFVGQYSTEFRFDRLFSSITGLTRTELIAGIEDGFASLPLGCHIHLQPQTRQQVLGALRRLTNQSWSRLSNELSVYAGTRGRDVQLGQFLHDQRVQLTEVYRDAQPSGWTALKASAGLIPEGIPPEEAALSRALRGILHSDDPGLLHTARRVAEDPANYSAETKAEAIRAQMLTYEVDTGRAAVPIQEFAAKLARFPRCASEMAELASLRLAESDNDGVPIPGLEDVPLALHAAYRRDDVLTAFGRLTATRRYRERSGVVSLKEQKREILFVTLDKSEGFHERIAYHDYAISPSRFHWQTQNSAGPDTTAGRRYIESRSNGWSFALFVRLTTEHPFRACGLVRLASDEDVSGDRPMNIIWTLEVPLSAALFQEFSILRGGA